jgi:predicted metallopeptidase
MCLELDAPLAQAPLVRCWNGPADPLPVRSIRALARTRAHPLGLEAPPWLRTGPFGEPFDFCGHVGRLCADIVTRCASLYHVDISRLLFAVTQARSSRVHGLQARVTPLRFHNGHLQRQRRGTSYQVQRYFVGGLEMLYVVTFCLPRFLDQEFDDKFITLFHELYHISPAFDGDLRRHDGRCALHSRSKRGYDAHMADLARAYLASGADPDLHAFLRLNFAQLEHRHGRVVGAVVPRPKLVPVPARKQEASRS